MIRSSVHSAGLAILLTVSGCGVLTSRGTDTPGLAVAESALQGGAAQLALQVSEGVLSGSPRNIHALEVKGDALVLLGQYDEAAAVYTLLLAQNADSIRANIGLGRIRLTRDPAAAEALFQKVVQHDPKNITALNNLGIARDLLGQHAQAQGTYRQLLAINPDMESAQVNLALSMAMSGQGPAAVELLQARAQQPGAPTKVKHDYAVVLAMSGNRPAAERVLSNDLTPEQTREVLDSVTGTHTRLTRDRAPGALSGAATTVASREDDDAPPDVVQIPETTAPPTRTARAAQPPVPPARSVAVTATVASPSPMIVRPRPADQDAGAPTEQPVNPIAAAVTNQRTLSLPMPRGFATTTPGATAAAASGAIAAAPAQTIIAPEVVPVPSTMSTRRVTLTRASETDAWRLALPDAPPPAPVMKTVPLPRGMQSAARAESAPTTAPAPAPVTSTAEYRNATQATSATQAEGRTIVASLGAPVRPIHAEDGSATVQFAAAPSEEAAHAFWQALVRRFPNMLSQFEPVVIRFEREGTVFWRVRASGFASASDAQDLCAKVHASGQDCFVPRS